MVISVFGRSGSPFTILIGESLPLTYSIIFFTLIIGMDPSPLLSSSIASEKCPLYPSPNPIMSHKEYIHVLPLPKSHTVASNNATKFRSLHSLNIIQMDAAKKDTSKGHAPTGQGKIEYPNDVSVNAEVVVVLESSSKRSKSLTKRVRFTRCSKDMKYLCAVCSKPDCMKCSNCM